MDCAIEKVKVKSVSPVKQALTGLRGIDLSISNLGAGRGLVVNLTPRPFYARERDPVPIVQESGWVSGPIWMQEKNLAPPQRGSNPATSRPKRDAVPTVLFLSPWAPIRHLG